MSFYFSILSLKIPPSVYPFAEKLIIFTAVLLGSVLILKILDRIIFTKYLFKKANIHVPALFRDIIFFTLLCVIILITLRIEFGVKLTGILTSSAIVSVIIGFALQDTLANIIAGIVLNIEQPFKIGDWVKIGEREGEVVEVNWRATRLKTLDGAYIVIPNTTISKDIVLNYYAPTKVHAITFHAGVEYKTSPDTVKAVLLKAVRDCVDVLKDPHPDAHVIDFGDHAILYEIKIWITDHSRYKHIKDDVMTKIWYNLKRHNMQIPYPIRTVYFEKKEASILDNAEVRKDIIKNIGIFIEIPDKDILETASASRIKHFTKGERIIIENEEGDSLYILISGSIDITINRAHIKELSKGEYLGEMSLLTGEKRSATATAKSEVTVLEIDKNAFLPIIEKHPGLMETLSKKLAERKLMTQGVLDKTLTDEKLLEKETLTKNIFHKIKTFFAAR